MTRPFASAPTLLPRLLFRDYIHSSLYHPQYGYFSSRQHPILQHTTPLHLPSLSSQQAYNEAVAATHTTNGHGWMTPIQLFSPYLSNAIARRISSLTTPSPSKPLHIIEIGAGRATLCHDCLSHWHHHQPSMLSNLHYHIIEISPELCAFQHKKLQKWIDREIVQIHNQDAIPWFQNLHKSSLTHKLQDSHCHIIATEVLDNLPHDLTRVSNSETDSNVLIEQAYVQGLEPGEMHSVGERLLEWDNQQLDNDIHAAIETFSLLEPPDTSYEALLPAGGFSLINHLRGQFETLMNPNGREVWVPTVAYQLFREIAAALPHTAITVADFDFLPGALPGENAPVVQRIEQGNAVVYDSVYAAPFGKVDIMFPTDFSRLLQAYQRLVQSNGAKLPGDRMRIMSQHQFFDEFADEQDKKDTTCKNGYNPVLSDFENATFFLVDGQE